MKLFYQLIVAIDCTEEDADNLSQLYVFMLRMRLRSELSALSTHSILVVHPMNDKDTMTL